MKLEIIKERETPLFKRKRVSCMVDFDAQTPSKLKLREEISKKLKVDTRVVAIRHIYQRFGLPRAKVIAHIYKNFETLKKVERMSDKKLEAYKLPEPKEEPKAEEAPKEEAKVEENKDGKEASKE